MILMAASSLAARGIYFNDSFTRADSSTVGNGWVENDAGGTTNISSGELNFDKDGTGTLLRAYRTFTTVDDDQNVTIELNITSPSTAGDYMVFRFNQGTGLSSQIAITFQLNNNNTFGIVDNGGLRGTSSWSPDTDYNVRLVVREANKNVDVWVNGTKIFDNTSYHQIGTNSFNTVNVWSDSPGPWNGALRDILVYNGTTVTAADDNVTITLLNPNNAETINDDPVQYQFSLSDVTGLANCTLQINGSNVSTQNGLVNGSFQFNDSTAEGSHNWQIICSDDLNTQVSELRTLDIDRSVPDITINPSNFFNTLNTTVVNKHVTPTFDLNVTVDNHNIESYSIRITAPNASDIYTRSATGVNMTGVTIAESLNTTGFFTAVTYLVEIVASDSLNQTRTENYAFGVLNEPAQASGISITNLTNVSLVVNWNALPAEADGVTLYRNGGFVANITNGSTSYMDTGLSPATEYTYVLNTFTNEGDVNTDETVGVNRISATTDAGVVVVALLIGAFLIIGVAGIVIIILIETAKEAGVQLDDKIRNAIITAVLASWVLFIVLNLLSTAL